MLPPDFRCRIQSDCCTILRMGTGTVLDNVRGTVPGTWYLKLPVYEMNNYHDFGSL
jgi:hypothetical protein